MCQEHDGKHYKIKEAVPGKNYPPLYPRCRSTTIVYRKENLGIRVARDKDGKIYKVVDDLNYKQWYNKYLKKDKKYK